MSCELNEVYGGFRITDIIEDEGSVEYECIECGKIGYIQERLFEGSYRRMKCPNKHRKKAKKKTFFKENMLKHTDYSEEELEELEARVNEKSERNLSTGIKNISYYTWGGTSWWDVDVTRNGFRGRVKIRDYEDALTEALEVKKQMLASIDNIDSEDEDWRMDCWK